MKYSIIRYTKAWELYSLLVPRYQALALPFLSERATQKPTQKYV